MYRSYMYTVSAGRVGVYMHIVMQSMAIAVYKLQQVATSHQYTEQQLKQIDAIGEQQLKRMQSGSSSSAQSCLAPDYSSRRTSK